MVLSDWEIVQSLLKDEIVITPLMNSERQIGSSSVDLRLGTEFKLIRIVKQTHFDLALKIEEIREQVREYTEVVHVEPMQSFILHPDEFALGSTLEYIILPKDIAGRLEGRSTWGRVGLQVHSTAGLVDPGFEGTLTFELHNMGKLPLPLYPGVRIGQISFQRCKPVVVGYAKKKGAKYAKSTGTGDTMFYEDYEYRQIRKFLDQKN
jgi:dCTP deaminase